MIIHTTETLKSVAAGESTVTTHALAEIQPHLDEGGYATRIGWLNDAGISIMRLGIRQVGFRVVNSECWILPRDVVHDDWVAIEEPPVSVPESENVQVWITGFRKD